jgi:hypothetical protein
MKKRDKLDTKHNMVCARAQKIYQNNSKLFRQGKIWKIKWLHEKIKNQDRNSLRILSIAFQHVL